jgi:peptidoglycan/LPS O-acetylase OafA/YrhL
METTRSTRETTRKDTDTARSPAVVATLSALLLLAASIVGQIAAGADYPTVPPGLVIPLVAAALLVWRTNRWTTGLALGVGLFIGAGAILTPNTGDHLSSGDTALIASTAAELVALATLVIAGAAATLPWKRTQR